MNNLQQPLNSGPTCSSYKGVLGFLILAISILVFKALLSVIVPAIVLNFLSLIIISVLFISYMLLQKFTQFKMLLLLFLCWLLLAAISSYAIVPEGVLPEFTATNFAQLAFPLIFLYVLLSLKYSTLLALIKYIKVIGMIILIAALIELLFVSDDLRLRLASYVLQSKLGDAAKTDAYYDVTLGMGYLRPGSILFEPLTTGMILISILMLYWGHKEEGNAFYKKFAYILIIFVGGVKSAIVTLLIAVGLMRWRYFVMPIALVLVVFTLFLLKDHLLAILQGTRIEGFESISNHLLGLTFGVINTLDTPWFGHGLGSAGYLIWLKCQAMEIVGPFVHARKYGGMGNGNESGLGVIIYQLGLVYGLALVGLMFRVILWFYKHKDYGMVSLMLGGLVFLMLSESSLSFSINAVMLPILVYRYRLNQYANILIYTSK